MGMDIRSLNALRRRVKDYWEAEADQPRAMIYLADQEGDREAVGGAFRTIASEMGLRHLRFDLANGLTEEHKAQLARKGPRIVVLTSLDGVQPDLRPALEPQVRSGARTLPVCLSFGTQEEIDRIMDAHRRLREMEARNARYRELLAEDDARRATVDA